MEVIFTVIMVVLIALTIFNLIVGVSNDAVNFLNSALGSKVASFWVIMSIASLGVALGATFSSGMMEVARKGIFHPEMLTFSEVMFVFLSVMLTNIILLDLFNTFGLPTSTTVSIVFELLGAAVAISLIKIKNNTDINAHLGDFINTDKALAIIAGILLSVIIAFTVGAIVQFAVRLVFSFNYSKSLKYYGALWGGFAITAITYFILIKGVKGTSFITDDRLGWIKSNSLYIIIISFIFWTVFLQILNFLFRINLLKIIILIGTFALAMAFAGNDLVNFIGVPLAALKAYESYSLTNIPADKYTMEILAEKVPTDIIYLLLAGVIMVLTLWLSKKSRNVAETEINLARQDEGVERFGSSFFSRSIVRWFIAFIQSSRAILPKGLLKIIHKRLDKSVIENKNNGKKNTAFDLVRASVNLVVASILISIATSMQLPLSTTYITFMVAMGTSLSDKAWGRESAVYRVTGVLSVIGGWFLTAFVAFTLSFVFAYIIYIGKTVAIIALILLVGFIIVRSHFMFRKREAEKQKTKELEKQLRNTLNIDALEESNSTIIEILKPFPEIFEKIINGLFTEDRKLLKITKKEVKQLNLHTKELKDNLHEMLSRFAEDSIESGHYYVQAIDYLREIVNCLTYITQPCFEHIDNNHNGLLPVQKEEISYINDQLQKLFSNIQNSLTKNIYSEFENIILFQENLLEIIHTNRKKHIKRIRKENVGTRNSILYLNILAETKNMLLYTIHLFKAQRDLANANTREKTNSVKSKSLT